MRFTIRDVLWATAVVALALGWWIDHQMLKSALREASGKWYHLSRSIWESGYDVDPREWRLIPRSDKPPSSQSPNSN
jgi:hypothetical protein